MSFVSKSVRSLLSLANSWTGIQTFTNALLTAFSFNGSSVSNLLVQRVSATYTANAALTTAIPLDDTIPQNTEGTEILSQAFTAKKVGNIIRITFSGQCSINAAGNASAALFVDSTANALQATTEYDSIANAQFNTTFVYEFSAADISSHTYRIRSGPGTATAVRFNGTSAARNFGGIMAAYMIIEEFAA